MKPTNLVYLITLTLILVTTPTVAEKISQKFNKAEEAKKIIPPFEEVKNTKVYTTVSPPASKMLRCRGNEVHKIIRVATVGQGQMFVAIRMNEIPRGKIRSARAHWHIGQPTAPINLSTIVMRGDVFPLSSMIYTTPAATPVISQPWTPQNYPNGHWVNVDVPSSLVLFLNQHVAAGTPRNTILMMTKPSGLNQQFAPHVTYEFCQKRSPKIGISAVHKKL